MVAESNVVGTCRNPRCLGNYEFEDIARYARMRFVDGYDTVTLLARAKTEHEKQEIALVGLLDVDDCVVRDMRLDCVHATQCLATDCRDRLKKLIERDLAGRQPS